MAVLTFLSRISLRESAAAISYWYVFAEYTFEFSMQISFSSTIFSIPKTNVSHVIDFSMLQHLLIRSCIGMNESPFISFFLIASWMCSFTAHIAFVFIIYSSYVLIKNKTPRRVQPLHGVHYIKTSADDRPHLDIINTALKISPAQCIISVRCGVLRCVGAYSPA